MHELSVCQSLIAQVEGISRQHGGARVETIQVSVGPLSGVEPKLLQQAYTIARAGTAAADAELVLEVPSLRVHCNACGAESEVPPTKLVCAACGAWQTRVVSGDELLLTSVVLETIDSPTNSSERESPPSPRDHHV